jgi:two-component system response regulator AtoC
VETDVRLVAATNRDLKKMVGEGKFREDLFYRLYVVAVHLPPLRERAGDLPLLVQPLRADFAKENGKNHRRASRPTRWMCSAPIAWPGNVRELRNVIERMVVLSRGPKLTVRELPPALRDQAAGRPGSAWPGRARCRSRSAEKHLIVRALRRLDGNAPAAAKELGISRRTLHRKLNEYGLRDLPGGRGEKAP